MRARVTNLGRGARGFHVEDGGTVLIEPGSSASLDLADHPAHRAWAAAGEVRIEPEAAATPDGEPFSRSREKVARRSRIG